jgi:hypothetical protein
MTSALSADEYVENGSVWLKNIMQILCIFAYQHRKTWLGYLSYS